MHAVSAFLGQNPPPAPDLCTLASHQLNPLSMPTHMPPLHLSLHNFNGQTILSTCAWYVPFWVKTPHPCLISVSWPPTTSTHTSMPTHMLPLHSPPRNFNAFAWSAFLGQNSPPTPSLCTLASHHLDPHIYTNQHAPSMPPKQAVLSTGFGVNSATCSLFTYFWHLYMLLCHLYMPLSSTIRQIYITL